MRACCCRAGWLSVTVRAGSDGEAGSLVRGVAVTGVALGIPVRVSVVVAAGAVGRGGWRSKQSAMARRGAGFGCVAVVEAHLGTWPGPAPGPGPLSWLRLERRAGAAGGDGRLALPLRGIGSAKRCCCCGAWRGTVGGGWWSLRSVRCRGGVRCAGPWAWPCASCRVTSFRGVVADPAKHGCASLGR